MEQINHFSKTSDTPYMLINFRYRPCNGSYSLDSYILQSSIERSVALNRIQVILPPLTGALQRFVKAAGYRQLTLTKPARSACPAEKNEKLSRWHAVLEDESTLFHAALPITSFWTICKFLRFAPVWMPCHLITESDRVQYKNLNYD